jgi:uncharacterized protein with von Willebrand factor type A (vWA) domain
MAKYFSTKKKSTYYDDWDDYYTPRAKKSTSSWSWKSGGWSKGAWSSFSFFGADVDENNENLFVKNPENYITPTEKEIRGKTHVYRQTSINTIKELARVCYLKMIEDRDFIAEKFADYDQLSDEDKNDYNTKKSFYETIYEQYIPGFTPLEQAVAIFLQMNKKETESGEEEQDDDNFKSTLDFNRELYSDPTINEQLEINELSKERKMQIMNNISLIADFGTQFKVEKEVDEKIVSNSDEYLTKIMRDYSQFHMLNLYQKMFPNFRTKFLTKDLTVNVPVDRKEKKQKIIIILDFSGSMSDHEKQIWVNAILIDRFRYVMKGEAEVFFSYFVDDPDDMSFQHIKDRDDVVKFWEKFSNHPNGGMTEVGLMVERIANEVENGKLMNLDVNLLEEKPEILVINDGQDSIHVDDFPYKVNAICLMAENNRLQELCVNSGGKKVYIDYNNELTLYSSEGTIKLK